MTQNHATVQAPPAEADARLLPHLCPDGGAAAGEWSHPLGEGVAVRLVLDGAEATAVTADLVAASGEDGAAWLGRAVANLRGRTPPGYLEAVGDSGILRGASGDSFDAARALLVGELVAGAADAGCFVAVPARDVLLTMPVTADSLTRLHILQLMAAKDFGERPSPISDAVYWVADGTWRRVGVERRDGSVRVALPPEMGAVLVALPGLERTQGPAEG